MVDVASGTADKCPVCGGAKIDSCDLVMKGGITSGIVYPGAVLALHKAGYRFRSIGGASAGAIAASITAAAQFGNNFAALVALQEKLPEPGFLQSLFQPTRETRPILDFVLTLQKHKSKLAKIFAAVKFLLWRFKGSLLTGALLTFLLLSWSIHSFGGGDNRASVWALATVVLISAMGGLLTFVGSLAGRLFSIYSRYLPGNFYGMCSGQPESADDALTPWLHERIQAAAGLEDGAPPLTFTQLQSDQREAYKVRLRMMTTDLTMARPIRLPLQEDDAVYYFRERELRRLFPSEVVDAMLPDATSDGERVGAVNEAEIADLFKLPLDDLPIIVATRMSLSFPILLSAVPLWTIRDGQPVQHWFSDGGIGSNFPIHFFDAWLPRRPTFGLNLVPSERAAAGTSLTALSPRQPRRTPIDSLGGFLGQIADTMQNWRDTMQAELPGFSDRIETIELSKEEGGMNLGMSKDTIENLINRGREKGEKLAREFCWDRHWFDRFEIFMRLLEEGLNGTDAQVNPGVRGSFDNAEFDLAAGMPTVTNDDRDPAHGLAWCKCAAVRTRALLDHSEGWKQPPDESFRAGERPQPTPVMRVTSRV